MEEAKSLSPDVSNSQRLNTVDASRLHKVPSSSVDILLLPNIATISDFVFMSLRLSAFHVMTFNTPVRQLL